MGINQPRCNASSGKINPFSGWTKVGHHCIVVPNGKNTISGDCQGARDGIRRILRMDETIGKDDCGGHPNSPFFMNRFQRVAG